MRSRIAIGIKQAANESIYMNDETIDKQVVDQLYWDSRVNASEVAVTVKNGKVTLHGTVPSYQAKSAGFEDAYYVRGVTYVDNQLKVKHPDVPSDAKMKEYVENVLFWDLDLDSTKVEASVKDGVATLTGTVGTYWEKYLAEDDAYRIGGVSEVTNELAIVLDGTWGDGRIAKDIESALERNFLVEVNDVDVKVADGTVTLSGEVPNWAARYAAYGCARYTSGVFEVVNDLIIKW